MVSVLERAWVWAALQCVDFCALVMGRRRHKEKAVRVWWGRKLGRIDEPVKMRGQAFERLSYASRGFLPLEGAGARLYALPALRCLG